MAVNGKSTVAQVTPETIKLWGGALSLDFANSVDWTDDDAPISPATDALTSPAALTRWGRRLGVVRGRAPAVGDEELEAALALRLVLHRLFSELAEGRRPRRADLEALARAHAEAAGAARLSEADDGAWRLEWPAGDPRRVRFAVA